MESTEALVRLVRLLSMPKRNDVNARAELVYPVVARIVGSLGADAASVRRVAEATGLTVSSLRHQWPSQSHLHLRCLQWLQARWDARWPYVTEEPATSRIRRVLAALVPIDESERERARAWQAFTSMEPVDEVVAGLLEKHCRVVARVVQREVDYARSRHREEQGQPPVAARIITPDNYVPAEPDNLDPQALLLLVLARGLTALVSDHVLPLSLEAAARWLEQVELGALVESAPPRIEP